MAKVTLTEKDIKNIHFLFYKLGMGAPSIARTLKLPIGTTEKFTAGLPQTPERRHIQLRTRYAGRLRHYERERPPLKHKDIEKLYEKAGCYEDEPKLVRRSMEIKHQKMPRLTTTADYVDFVALEGTYCRDCGNGQIILGTDTITENRLVAVVTSMRARRRVSFFA